MAYAARSSAMSRPAAPSLGVPGGSRATRLTLSLGSAVTLVLIALAAVDAGGQSWLWDHGHWTAAAVTAVVAGMVGARAASGLERRVRIGMTVVAGIWLVGQLVFSAYGLAGEVPIPSLADVVFLVIPIPVGAMLILTARRYLSGARRTALYLDAAAVLLATVALVVVAHPMSTRPGGGFSVESVVGLAYAMCFIATAAATFTGAITTRARIEARGIYLVLAGVVIVGFTYSWWLVVVAAGGEQTRTLPGYLLSIGLLLAAGGVATWSSERETRPRALRAEELAQDALPLGAVVIAAASLLVPDIPEMPHEIMVELAVAGTTVLLVARQTILLRDRGLAVQELRRASAVTEEALDANRRLAADLAARIGEMESVQRQLIHASRQSAVGQLASAIAHEVNNPLTGVLGYTDLLLAELPPEARREELEIIRSEALRARRIVRSLVEFARPHDPEQTPTDLDAHVRATIDLLRYHHERAGIRILEAYGGLPVVALDRAAIAQVVVNIVTNAVEAMSEGGELRVSTAIDGRDAVLTIADDGHGMDEPTLARVFEPYFTTLALDQGHGLGMAVSLGIVEAHGGTIRLASHPGSGTTVEVRLPLDPRPVSRGAAPGASAVPA